MSNIDALYTGTNNDDTTFGNEDVDSEQLVTITEQQQLLAELLPSVQYIRDICDDEIDAIKDIRAYMTSLGEKPDAEAIASEYRARELYIGFVNRLKDNIENMVANAETEANK